jgi:hypothetical protein
MKPARVVILLIAASFLTLARGYCEPPIHLSAADRGTVPSSLFNLNILYINQHSGWPAMPFAAWRDFHFNMSDLEPQKDQWNFTAVDHDVQEAAKHGIDLVAILQRIPTWAGAREEAANPVKQIGKPASMSDWTDYVRTVAERYKGKIHYYELWNEPENVGTFLRQPSALMALNRVAYETLKSVDPTIVVVSSALSSGDPVPDRPGRHLSTFANAGIMKYCDVVAYHFYVIPFTGSTTPRTPEDTLPYITAVKAEMKREGLNKPLWSTESGWALLNNDENPETAPWYHGKLLDPETGASYLARTYILGWSAGLDRIFWYCWRHGYMGMTEFSGAPKAPGIAYTTVQRWLVGAQMSACDKDKEGHWLCQLTLADGAAGVIAWSDSKPASIALDPAWQAHSYQTIDGLTHDLGSQTSVQISGSPILLVASKQGSVGEAK